MRNPAAIGFYPGNKEILAATINHLLSCAKRTALKKADGIIVPHAGYAYSGQTAACVYASIPKEYDTIILLGTNHTGQGKDIAVSTEDWLTPLGIAKNDTETGEKICSLSKFASHDELAHLHEHSIEVQIPFLQSIMGKFKIVPIAVSGGLPCEQYADLAGAIRKSVEGKNALVIASSDFTHYGEAYGFSPECRDANKWVHETDKKIISGILSGNAPEFLELAEKSTVCGIGAIYTLLKFTGKKKGMLLDYRTSCDVSFEKRAIVGYAGIIF